MSAGGQLGHVLGFEHFEVIHAERPHFDTGQRRPGRELVDMHLGRQSPHSGLLEQQAGFLQAEIPLLTEDVHVVRQFLRSPREHLLHHVARVGHGILESSGTAWQPRKVVFTGMRSRAPPIGGPRAAF